MRKRITIKDLQSSACAHLNPHLQDKPRKKKNRGIKIEKRSAEKDWLLQNLTYWCNENSLILEEEVKFHEERRWRFDYVVRSSEIKVAIEYEGLFSEKSRHTTVSGYSGDTDKYREAAKDGYIVQRYTAMNYKKVLRDLEEIFKTK